MTNSTQKAAQPQTTKHGHKWCEHCQKTDHNDDECWSTRIVSTAETMARRLPQRKPGLRIFYRTSYADFQAMVKRQQPNSIVKAS